MVSWPAEMIRISSDLQILEKLHLLDIYDKKNQHRLSDTETLKIAFEAWPEHICSVPVGVFTFHGSQRKRNESEGVGRHGCTKKTGCTKSLVMPHPLGLFDDVPCSFSRHLRIHFVESFSILWLGSSMVHPVHPDSFTFFWLANHLHAGTLPYFLTTRLSHVLWTAGRWWDGRWVGMGGDVHDFHSALVKLKTWIV